MKFKKLIIKGVLSLVSVSLLSSCDFSDDDDCVYYGTLKAEIDWSHLKEDQGKPEVTDMNIVYYPETGKSVTTMTGKGERFEENPLIRDLNIGKYKFLFFNKATNPVKGLESKVEEGEIYSDLTTSAGKTFITTKQQFVYSLLSDTEEIKTDDTTYVKCNAKILVQKLVFNFNLTGAVEAIKIDSVSAILHGVTTSRRLYDQKRGIEYASLHFTTNKIEDRRYTSSVLVFGINNTPDNKVDIIVDTENGGRIEAEVDLNDVLDNFIADQKEIDIDVEISVDLKITATIRDWRDKDWGAIILN